MESNGSIIKPTSKKRKPYSDDFESFWQAYPMRNGKRVGKAEAYKHFGKLSDEDRTACMASVANYAEHIAARDEFAKDAERYIKHRIWEDFLEPAKRESRVATAEEVERWDFETGGFR